MRDPLTQCNEDFLKLSLKLNDDNDDNDNDNDDDGTYYKSVPRFVPPLHRHRYYPRPAPLRLRSCSPR